jgi:hypothetical protein
LHLNTNVPGPLRRTQLTSVATKGSPVTVTTPISRLRAKGLTSEASEWIVRRTTVFEDRVNRMLSASDGFELRDRHPALWTVLRDSNQLRNNLIHHTNLPVTTPTALQSLTGVLGVIRLLDPPAFWRAMFGFAGLPRDTIEIIEAPVRSICIRFGVPKATTPTLTLRDHARPT